MKLTSQSKTYSLSSLVVEALWWPNYRGCEIVKTRQKRGEREEEKGKKISELELLSWAERVGNWVEGGERGKNGRATWLSM
jgi:hypothetical protein